jgi:acyl-CoA thioesterase-2
LLTVTVNDLDDSPPADSGFVERLTLNRIDRDIFMGWCHAGSPLRAFGGQVAAQALVAAGTTVEQPGRVVHSLHAYFLRAGSTSDHIIYMVDRPRDGRSFSTRRVRAVQYGKTIFTMSASYADPQRGPGHTAAALTEPRWMAAIPSPDTLDRLDILETLRQAGVPEENGLPEHGLVDIRFVDADLVQDLSSGRFHRMAWVRTADPLPDPSLFHVCAMTYFSDLTLAGTVLGHHGGFATRSDLDVASLDHAMWFHAPFRADEWLLFATTSPVSGSGHGFAAGQFYRADGTLVSSAAQEVLMREPW